MRVTAWDGVTCLVYAHLHLLAADDELWTSDTETIRNLTLKYLKNAGSLGPARNQVWQYGMIWDDMGWYGMIWDVYMTCSRNDKLFKFNYTSTCKPLVHTTHLNRHAIEIHGGKARSAPAKCWNKVTSKGTTLLHWDVWGNLGKSGRKNWVWLSPSYEIRHGRYRGTMMSAGNFTGAGAIL